MSKLNLKCDYLLPKHQKKIMLCLAKYGVMTMSETNRKLHGENTSTTRAFHELERKEMVKVRGVEPYRGRNFSKYWLSGRGIGFVLLNGANPEKTRSIALAVSEGKLEKSIETYFKLRDVSPKIANVLDTLLVLVGTLSPEEMFGHLLVRYSTLEDTEKHGFFEAIKDSEEFAEALSHLRKELKGFANGGKKGGV
jgi:hypothetical protein